MPSVATPPFVTPLKQGCVLARKGHGNAANEENKIAVISEMKQNFFDNFDQTD